MPTATPVVIVDSSTIAVLAFSYYSYNLNLVRGQAVGVEFSVGLGTVGYSFEEMSPRRNLVDSLGNAANMSPRIYPIPEDGQYTIFFDNRNSYLDKFVQLTVGIGTPSLRPGPAL